MISKHRKTLKPHMMPIQRFVTSPNAVSLPLFITKAIISLKAPTAVDIFMATLEAANDFEKDKADTVTSATESLKEILPYLWTAHHNKIGTVETSPHISKDIAAKTASFHNNKILKIPVSPRQFTSILRT